MRILIFLIFSLVLSIPSYAQRRDLQGLDYRNNQSGQRMNVRASIYFNEADNALLSGDLVEAENALDKAIAVDPYFAEAYLKRALLMYRLNRPNEAEQAYRTAQRLNPYVADIYGYNGQQARLEVMAFEPSELVVDPVWHSLLQYYERYYYENTPELDVDDDIDDDVKLDYLLLDTLFWDAMQHQEYMAAREYLHQMQRLNPEVRMDDIEALAEWELGEVNLAMSIFSDLILKNPNSPTAYYHLAVLELEKQQRANALEHIEQALKIDSKFAPAYFLRATIRKLNKDATGSLSDLNQYEKLTQRNSTALLVNRSLARKMTGDALGALKDINLAIQTSEYEDAKLFKIRGNLLVLLGRYDEALLDYNDALQLKPDNPKVYYNRAIALLLTYNRGDACQDLESAINLGYKPAKEMVGFFCMQ